MVISITVIFNTIYKEIVIYTFNFSYFIFTNHALYFNTLLLAYKILGNKFQDWSVPKLHIQNAV